jgi:hypothetical protein
MYSAAKRQGVAAGLQRKESKCSRVKGVLAPSLDPYSQVLTETPFPNSRRKKPYSWSSLVDHRGAPASSSLFR